MLTRFKNYDFTWLKQYWGLDQGIVSLHFTAATIRIILVNNTPAGQELAEIYLLELPQELKKYAWIDNIEHLSNYVQANINHLPLGGKRAIAIVDTQITCLKELNMPLLNATELEQAVQWDALQHLPYLEGEYAYGYLSAKWGNVDGEGLKISLIAMEKKVIKAIKSVASKLKLELLQVTSSDVALRELVQNTYLHFAILDLGWENSCFSIFDGDRPIYQAKIGWGRARFATALSLQLGVSTVMANNYLNDYRALNNLLQHNVELGIQLQNLLLELITQISLDIETCRVKQRDLLLEALIVAGTMPALESDLINQIGVQLNIYSENIQPLEHVLIADHLSVSEKDTQLGSVVGAILMLNRTDSLNVLTANQAVKNSRYHRICKLILTISACFVICLAAYELILLGVYKYEYQNIVASNSQLTVWRQRRAMLTNLEQDASRRELLLNQLKIKRTVWPQILLAFGYNIPDGLSITGISRVKEEDNYLLRGKASDIQAVSDFITVLQQTGAFKQILLQHLAESSSMSSTGEFMINLKGMGTNHATDTGEATKLP